MARLQPYVHRICVFPVKPPITTGDYGVDNIRSTSQQVALIPPQTIPGQGNLTLCACDDVKAEWCHNGKRKHNFEYTVTTIEARQKEAAAKLADLQVKTFNDSGVPQMISHLRTIANLGMPEESFQNFQTSYPLSKCSIKPSPSGLEQARKRGMIK